MLLSVSDLQMSGLLSEKDMEARLGEYEEREERRGCCQDIDAVMDRYEVTTFTTSNISTLFPDTFSTWGSSSP